MATPTSLDVLSELHNYQLNLRDDVGQPANISSITLVSGTSYQINFSNTLDGAIFAGCLVYAGFNPNQGYYIIQSLGTNYVRVDNGSTLTTTGAIGQCKFYTSNTGFIDNIINTTSIPYCERIARTSFSGLAAYIDILDGQGGPELFLKRRHINSLTEIILLNLPNSVLSIPISAIELVPNEGILRVRAINLESYTMIAPVFPKGVKNIKVTYMAGYAAMPNDIKRAVVLLTAANVLGVEAGITGGGTSISVASYSKTFSNRGKYGEVRDMMAAQARSILSKYKSGIV